MKPLGLAAACSSVLPRPPRRSRGDAPVRSAGGSSTQQTGVRRSPGAVGRARCGGRRPGKPRRAASRRGRRTLRHRGRRHGGDDVTPLGDGAGLAPARDHRRPSPDPPTGSRSGSGAVARRRARGRRRRGQPWTESKSARASRSRRPTRASSATTSSRARILRGARRSTTSCPASRSCSRSRTILTSPRDPRPRCRTSPRRIRRPPRPRSC